MTIESSIRQLPHDCASSRAALSLPFFVIAGPTAVGKSDIAVEVAERCGGEIVGADAFQVYTGLDILTAKPPPGLLARVRHHCLGEIPLTHTFDVAQYHALAARRLAEIHDRGKTPIVVGGTGLYLRALMRGLADLPGADPELRARFEAQPFPDLVSQLLALDAEAAETIDLKNPRRVIRALEVCILTGQPFTSFRDQWSAEETGIRGVVLTLPREALHERIHRRTQAMLAAGVRDEVANCGPIGPTASQVLGLKQVQALLRGDLTADQCIGEIAQATRHYAKRQMTWFRRESALTPVAVDAADRESLVRNLAEQAGRAGHK